MAILVPDEISPHLHDLLTEGPKEGGSHYWLMAVAGSLKRYVSEEGMVEILTRLSSSVPHRSVPEREILETVRKAYSTQASTNVKWPSFSPSLTRDTIERFSSLSDIQEREEFDGDPLSEHFTSDELLCVANDLRRSRIVQLHEITGEEEWIVPNPMLRREGVIQSGTLHVRCKRNVRERRFLVLEADIHPPGDQLALLRAIHSLLPSSFIVWSGKKSYHGWFKVEDYGLDAIKEIFSLAMELGFCRSTFNPAQLVRFPGGWRHREQTRQTVYVFRGERT